MQIRVLLKCRLLMLPWKKPEIWRIGVKVGQLDGSIIQDRYQFIVMMSNLNYDVPQDKLDAQIMDFKVSRQNQLTYWYFPSRLLPNKSGLLPKLNNCYSISTDTSRRGVSWKSSRAGSLRTCTGFQECFSMREQTRRSSPMIPIRWARIGLGYKRWIWTGSFLR